MVEAGGAVSSLAVDIDGTSNKFDIQGSHATFDLTEQGAASNLASDMIDDPVDGAFVKNASSDAATRASSRPAARSRT